MLLVFSLILRLHSKNRVFSSSFFIFSLPVCRQQIDLLLDAMLSTPFFLCVISGDSVRNSLAFLSTRSTASWIRILRFGPACDVAPLALLKCCSLCRFIVWMATQLKQAIKYDSSTLIYLPTKCNLQTPEHAAAHSKLG